LFVVDASIAASWFLEDEGGDQVGHAWQKLRAESAIVPSIWWYEIRNALLIAERKRRIVASDVDRAWRELWRMRIEIDFMPDDRAILRLARAYSLTVHDAAYVELAARMGCPLATLDDEMATAAKAERIPLIDHAR
jgi:predicted nucleic acid-binding protein